MPDFYISQYEEKEFDVYTQFKDSKGKKMPVEGHKYVIRYRMKEGAKVPSDEQILRNYINAIKKVGGTLVYKEWRNAYIKIKKNNKVTWIRVYTGGGGKEYYLTIIEEQSMVQEVVADANAMAQDISTIGHVVVYGIYFDFDKTDVKPESAQALEEIAKLLKQNNNLKLYVVGHTDNVGDFDYNMKLSQGRADAVVKKLIADYGINENMLKSYGIGPLSPVASNKTEEGQTLNRRVELVQQ
jgi:outer membrane protein OmpA-like peptidoglycan-associated protein